MYGSPLAFDLPLLDYPYSRCLFIAHAGMTVLLSCLSSSLVLVIVISEPPSANAHHLRCSFDALGVIDGWIPDCCHSLDGFHHIKLSQAPFSVNIGDSTTNFQLCVCPTPFNHPCYHPILFLPMSFLPFTVSSSAVRSGRYRIGLVLERDSITGKHITYHLRRWFGKTGGFLLVFLWLF